MGSPWGGEWGCVCATLLLQPHQTHPAQGSSAAAWLHGGIPQCFGKSELSHLPVDAGRLVERGLKATQPPLFLHTLNSTFLIHPTDLKGGFMKSCGRMQPRMCLSSFPGTARAVGSALQEGPHPPAGAVPIWTLYFQMGITPCTPTPPLAAPPLPGLHCTGCSPEPHVQQVNKSEAWLSSETRHRCAQMPKALFDAHTQRGA